VSHDRVRLVWLLQGLNILVGQLDLEGVDHFCEVFQLRSADNGGGDLLRAPSKCDLGHLDSFLVGEFINTFDNGLAGIIGFILTSPGIRFSSSCALLPGAGKHTPGEGAPRDTTNTKVIDEGEHLAFFLSVEQAMVVLHGDERSEVVENSIVLHSVELPSEAAAHSNVASMSSLDYIVQSMHRFLDRGVRVKPVTLKNIHVVNLKAFEAGLYRIEDVLARKTVAVDVTFRIRILNVNLGQIFSNRVENLGQNDNLLSGNLELLEGLPEDDLGLAVGVYISSIEGVDPSVECELDVLDTLFFTQHPILPLRSPIAHASKDDFADFQARLSKADISDRFLVLVILVGVSIFVILAGGKTSSVIGIACGSWQYYLTVFLAVPYLLVVDAYCVYRLIQKERYKLKIGFKRHAKDLKWTRTKIFLFPLSGFLVGLAAGVFGLGGGTLQGPLMLSLGVGPAVMSATSLFIVLISAVGALIQYLGNGTLPWDYCLWFLGFGIWGAFFGKTLLDSLIKRFKRQSLIIAFLALLIGLVLIALLYVAISRIASGNSSWAFKHICNEVVNTTNITYCNTTKS